MAEQEKTSDKQTQNKGIPNAHKWKPGQSGNPAGRPKKVKLIPELLTEIGNGKLKDFTIVPENIRNKLLEYDPEITVEKAREVLAYLHALKGENWANQHIDERTEGKVKQPIGLDQPILPPVFNIISASISEDIKKFTEENKEQEQQEPDGT